MQNEHTEIRPKDSKFLYFWGRLPVIVRAVAQGLVVGLAVFVWPVLTVLNLETTLQLPWSVAVMAVFLWFYWRYLNGSGWPRSTSVARRTFLRGSFPKGKALRLSMTAMVLGAVCSEAAWLTTLRLVVFPPETFLLSFNVDVIPWWTLIPALVMTSFVAGLVEEAAYRGYMQVPLEKRYGPVAGIFVVTIIFTFMHFYHDWASMAIFPSYVVFGLFMGALSYAAQSIWPAVIAHTAIDIYQLLYEWQIVGTYNLTQVKDSGIDTHFIIVAGLTLLTGLAAIVVLKRLVCIRDE